MNNETKRIIEREFQAHMSLSADDKLKAMIKFNRPALSKQDVDYIFNTEYVADETFDKPEARRFKRLSREEMIADYEDLIERSKVAEMGALEEPSASLPTKVERVAETAPKQPTPEPKQPKPAKPVERERIDWTKPTFKLVGND